MHYAGAGVEGGCGAEAARVKDTCPTLTRQKCSCCLRNNADIFLLKTHTSASTRRYPPAHFLSRYCSPPPPRRPPQDPQVRLSHFCPGIALGINYSTNSQSLPLDSQFECPLPPSYPPALGGITRSLHLPVGLLELC